MKEILDKYIDLKSSCLTEKERSDGNDKYKDAFSLRDEIGTRPNTEVEIDVMDESHFSLGPYQVKEDDKALIDKEMKRLCYLRYTEGRFSAYSSPVMLTSRKLTKDKRVVTDFRHLNVRIAKTHLAYPLLQRYVFSIQKL